MQELWFRVEGGRERLMELALVFHIQLFLEREELHLVYGLGFRL